MKLVGHARFKISCLRACRFDSDQSYFDPVMKLVGHARFKISCLRACRFDSDQDHYAPMMQLVEHLGLRNRGR